MFCLSAGIYKCGVRPVPDYEDEYEELTPFVFNGKIAEEGELPWMAQLNLTQPDSSVKPICGGVLISTRSVATAAHCVSKEIKVESVHLGSGIRGGGDVYKVIKVVRHEKYDGSKLYYKNDIAILSLHKNVEFKDSVYHICLPKYHDTFYEEQAMVAGWGLVDSYDQKGSEKLKVANVTIERGRVDCESGRATLTNKMLCAKGALQNVCRGDSGGPLMCKRENRTTLCGLISGGHKSCDTRYHSVFTRISQYRVWIKRQIEDPCPQGYTCYTEECSGHNGPDDILQEIKGAMRATEQRQAEDLLETLECPKFKPIEETQGISRFCCRDFRVNSTSTAYTQTTTAKNC